MAATLDPGTQAGIGAFAGLVEVSVNQVRRTHLVRVAPAPIEPEPIRELTLLSPSPSLSFPSPCTR